ncbi:MAG: tetraacyldisaccharide 4'-kinase, partial [Candidatus Glassbacteria bacterium]|nr:tetraacyldisaccharide 4'-kinase [Candidatus Glassbacteria bacterium]
LIAFEDHCRYSTQMQQELRQRATRRGAVLVTTEKDAVKLRPELVGPRCLVLCLACLPADEQALDRLLDELLAGGRNPDA